MRGGFAEFETNLRRERQLEGISAAEARRVYKGRKPSIGAGEVCGCAARRSSPRQRSAGQACHQRRSGVAMPIKPELRWLCPIDWPQISRHVRFERAGGVCQGCGRPHGKTVRCLPDGRWYDAARRTWRSHRGGRARWPNIEEATCMRHTRVVLAAAHLDHNPGNNRLGNLRSFCQRCHLIHDRPHHLVRRRITYPLRRALGDLFLGPYSASFDDRWPDRHGNGVAKPIGSGNCGAAEVRAYVTKEKLA